MHAHIAPLDMHGNLSLQ
uniref:Uncharacterized protein n=1 Tax=Arundo donax TaxID=35708 RepID=A0A0A8YR84_ARUDO